MKHGGSKAEKEAIAAINADDYALDIEAIVDTPNGEININGYKVKIPSAVRAIIIRASDGAEPIGLFVSLLDQKAADEYDAFEREKGGQK
ncbi:MAG: hypothetical protein LBE89_07815 [Helicobacteraceae bacterium]|nr:hypothetical protein [Helicobacteraceae bacterium]